MEQNKNIVVSVEPDKIMPRLTPVEMEKLRQRIHALDGTIALTGVVPFGLKAIDYCLPGGGLSRSAVHEICGEGRGGVDGAVSALFAAGIAARASGPVIWVSTQEDLFAPGLLQSGLNPDRLIEVRPRDETAGLAACEEALRHRGIAAVVCEVSHLSLTASRRLQLAAEGGHGLCLIVRRFKREKDVLAGLQPTAATTRWRVKSLPSQPLNVPGLGRARWRLELLRCKGAEPALFDVEAFDDKACLALAAPLVYRPALQTSNAPSYRQSAAS